MTSQPKLDSPGHGPSAEASVPWEDPFLLGEQLTEDERLIAEAARNYSQEQLLPRITEAYRLERFDREIMSEMGEMGFLGVNLPEPYGSGANYVSYGLIARAVENVDVQKRDQGRFALASLLVALAQCNVG